MSQTRPILASALEGATRVTDLSIEADYSYSMDRCVGDGWALVGDAARFVDPIFSSGVSIACYSAKYAAEEIIGGLEEGDVGAARLQPDEAKLKSGVTVWYEFITLYYKLMNLFTYFVAKDEYQHQIVLLQGEVFDRESVPVLDEMRKMIEKVESSPDHLWKGQLGGVPI